MTSFTLSLVDGYGLSTSVTASTRASKLPSVTASPTGGIITINGTVEFSNSVPGATLVLESDIFDGGKIEGAGPISLPFTNPGTYNITAYAKKSGAADSDKITFTYKVVDDSTVYVSEIGDDNNPGTEDKPVATLQRALDLLNKALFTEGKIVVTGTVQTGEVKITAPDDSTNGSVTTLTVRGGSAGGTLKNENGRVFNIASGGSLTLEENITLTGTNDAGNGGAVYVNGGNFIMKNGSKITGSSAKYGGGVYVDGKGTFTMDGGTISKNRASSTDASGTGASGGGVCISDGTFTMSDGAVISKNTATSSGGGVFVSQTGIFTMEGGTIGGTEAESANSAENGGGVFVGNNGTFTMNGGIISANNAGMTGGGVNLGASGATMTLEDGTISGNNATMNGGGVGVSTGNFTMSGGTISGNTAAQKGGGVYVSSTGNFTLGSSSTAAASSPVVSGNTKNGNSPNNVYLDGTILLIEGELKKSKEFGNIGISMATPGEEFTYQWDNSGLTDTIFFFSDDTKRTVALSGSELSLNLVRVEGGSCTLNNKEVTLSSFWISPYEVTQEEFKTIMTGNQNNIELNPSEYQGDEKLPADGEEQKRRPVERVRWYEAIVYCNLLSMKEDLTPCYTIKGSTNPALWGTSPTSNDADWDEVTCNFYADGYRLPTEAEWEYAARGGQTGQANNTWNCTYSGSNTINEVAWYMANSGSKTHEVGKKQANALGLYDMSGNVSEWCWDWRSDPYPSNTENPAGSETGEKRVSRGGRINTGDSAGCGVGDQNSAEPYEKLFCFGFRVVRSIR